MRVVPRGKEKAGHRGCVRPLSLRKPVGVGIPEGGPLCENVPPRILARRVAESILERERQALRWDLGDAAACS